jgi:transposase-like protein
MQGRKTAIRLVLSEAEHATLTQWARATARPAGLVRRAQLLLLVAQGVPLAQVARRVGLTRRAVYTWVERFQTAGLAALGPPGRGARPRSGP